MTMFPKPISGTEASPYPAVAWIELLEYKEINMGNRIRFFFKQTGEDAPDNLYYFVERDGTVWRDNEDSCESQSAVVGFDTFVMPCPDVDWELMPSNARANGQPPEE